MRFWIAIVCLLSAHSALAEILVPARTIRAKEVISYDDLAWKKADAPGAISQLEDVVGNEARITLYQGRPISRSDIGPAAIIDRNQIVTVLFVRGGLEISTEARALNRAAIGEQVRVMNLSSRTTISGVVTKTGTIRVKQ